MTKKADTLPQETFDHGQARLLPTPLRPSELIKRLEMIFADERPMGEDIDLHKPSPFTHRDVILLAGRRGA